MGIVIQFHSFRQPLRVSSTQSATHETKTTQRLNRAYCAQVYGSAGSTIIGNIQKVLNFAARILSNRRKYDHISDVPDELDWLNSKQFIAYSDLGMVHKIISTGRPEVLELHDSDSTTI